MANRRNFIKTTGLAGLLTAGMPASHWLSAASSPLKILILGGTGFLGPHTVEAAKARGHQITLFNRGKTNPDLFSELETIKGDRNTDDIKKLANRKWDAVIDTSGYFPRAINSAMSVLKSNINHYLFVSTISVYDKWSTPGMDEKSPVGKLADPRTEKVDGESYGPLKALCEQAAESQMPGRVCNIRPGLIVGPLDKTDRFTYWPARTKQGGDILAPGDGTDFVQFIDVRDLAEWMVHCIENRISGIYNALSPQSNITIGKLLQTCVSTLNPKAKLVWVPSEFLEKHSVAPWQEMPVWIPPKGDFLASGRMSSKKAIATGLKQRPLGTIIRDCDKWFSGLPESRQQNLRAGIKADKEKKVLDAWQKHQQEHQSKVSSKADV